MTIFERLWATITSFLTHLIGAEAPVVVAWAKQFATDEGQVILTDAAVYGPQILAKSITITDAAAKLGADLAAKGMQDVQNLEILIFNALRTQTNAAAVA